jgi:hypothetical protein
MKNLLIITNSYDVTTDLLLVKLEQDRVFRFDFDQIDQYVIRFDSDGFFISAPDGRTITSDQVSKVYWRKPFSADPEILGFDAIQYVMAEWRYLLTEMVNFLWAEKKFVLVEPFAELRTGKLLQLRHAKNLFEVPPYEFISSNIASAAEAVVKSLSGEPVDRKVMYTKKVRTGDPDERYPWFLQQYVTATHDITAVFIRSDVFAFELERNFLGKSPDWREHMSADQLWNLVLLPAALLRAVSTYMADLKLDFGRLDFLLDQEGRYWFCEVNPNGQFAWLDLTSEHGLLDAVIREISPATEVSPIPNSHPLRPISCAD